MHWIAEHAYIYPLKIISNKMIYNVWPLQKTLWNIDIHTCLLDSTFLCPHLPSGNTCLLRNKDISIGADLQWKKVYTGAEKRWTMGLRTIFPSIDVINKYANYSAVYIKMRSSESIDLLSKNRAWETEVFNTTNTKIERYGNLLI